MDRPTPTRTDVHDGPGLSPVPAPHGGRRKKGVTGPPPQPGLPAIRQVILDHILRPPPDNARTVETFYSSPSTHAARVVLGAVQSDDRNQQRKRHGQGLILVRDS